MRESAQPGEFCFGAARNRTLVEQAREMTAGGALRLMRFVLARGAAGRSNRPGGDGGKSWRWAATSGIWFALLVVEEGKIVRYGFTSAKSQKEKMREALRKISGSEALLLGVWTGSHRTDLFVLDISKAIAKL